MAAPPPHPAMLADPVTGSIVASCVLGGLWSVKEYIAVKNVAFTGPSDNEQGLLEEDKKKHLETMIQLGKTIQAGADAFLFAEYKYLTIFVVLFSVPVWYAAGAAATIAFVLGCFTSTLAGWAGMKIATFTNNRTTHECWAKGVSKGFDCAMRGGSVMGFSLVCMGLFNLLVLIWIFLWAKSKHYLGLDNDPADAAHPYKTLFEAIAGYGLGGSSIALFGRVGGGIYTKAADVGADLAGKLEMGYDEDDPRNPATIADNVGDNVGDIAGMGADLFGSFAESTCAALVVAASSSSFGWNALMFPLLLSASGIISGILTLSVVNVCFKVSGEEDATGGTSVERALKGVLTISTVIESGFIYGLAVYCFPAGHALVISGKSIDTCAASVPVLLGLWSGLAIGYSTEYYTSHSYDPVQQIVKQHGTNAATGIIYGLAVGYDSCVIPILCLAVSILVSHKLVGMYGVALAALGMLSTMTMGLTIDAYGPISDNAGGVAEMSELPANVRKITDILDAAGNTTAAIGKGFAIGSAALVSLALFGAFTVRAGIEKVDILNPYTFTGLLVGAMIPFYFSAMTMRSVAMAAADMVEECKRQYTEGGDPDPKKCIEISTNASLREMVKPGILVIFSPIVAGLLCGKQCTAGLLTGALVSGVQMAISMSNTGGAWDNAKKFIEKEGNKKDANGKITDIYSNAVIGDTVGDPLKDTSGPAINIVMKLSAIISLVFGSFIAAHSTSDGGPAWLH